MTIVEMKDSVKNRWSNMTTPEKVLTCTGAGALIGGGIGIAVTTTAGIGASIATGAMAGTIGISKAAFGATAGSLCGATAGAITSAIKTSR